MNIYSNTAYSINEIRVSKVIITLDHFKDSELCSFSLNICILKKILIAVSYLQLLTV